MEETTAPESTRGIYEESEFRFFRNNIINRYYDQICFTVFCINEKGPSVLWEGISENFNAKEASKWANRIGTMAVNFMVTLGMGHNYTEGVYELPLPDINGYRALVCCLMMNGSKLTEEEKENSYYQLVIKTPIEFIQNLHSPAYYQDDLIAFLHDNLGNDISKQKIETLKPEILYMLSDQFVRAEKI
ncbi:MAG: hypothetical protein ACW99A_04510 [Candidatus Kariarchaeaceae archaeon]